MSPEDLMRLILALDPGASLMFSTTTGQWYVSADVGISNETIITGIAEHRASPQGAIAAYVDRLAEINVDHFEDCIVAKPYGERRRYRWNGAAFAEIPPRIPSTTGAPTA